MVKVGGQGPIQQPPAFTAVLQTATGGHVVVPGGEFLQSAEFVRAGPDLILVGADGTQILVKDYFAQPTPPALVSDNGASIDPDLAAILAGPVAPGQFAQAAANDANDAAIGKVSVLHGKVMVRHADGSRSELHQGDSVFADDVIETGKGGSVGLTFEDGTTFSLGSGGRMVLDDLVYDPASHTGSGNIAVLQGSFTFVSGQIPKTSPEAMTVKTPSMTVGIRGTAGAGNTQTVVLMAEQGGVAGELVITTPSGQTITVNVPGLAATVSPGGALLTVQMSPTQIQALAGNSLNALPNPGNLSNEYNTGNNNPNQDNPLQPPPGQTQQEVQQAVQNAVEQALAQQQAAQAAAQATEQIAQLTNRIEQAVVTARRDAVQQAVDALNTETAAHQDRIADAVAAVRAIRDLISPLVTDAQNALTSAENAFALSDSDAVQNAVDAQLAIAQARWDAITEDDSDAVTAGIQTLMERALAATQGTENGQPVTYAEAVAVYNTEILTLRSEASAALSRIEALSNFNTLAKTWTDGSAIRAKLDTQAASKAANEAVTGPDGDGSSGLQKAANDAATAEADARAAARDPIITEAQAQAEWDVRLDGLAETRASLGKAAIDYVTLHQGLSGADTTYGLTSGVMTAYNAYKALIDAKPADTSLTDYHQLTTVQSALADLKAAMVTAGLTTNDYSQAVSAWMTTETSATLAESEAHTAYSNAHDAAEAARDLIDTATLAASDAAAAYATGQTAAASAADDYYNTRYKEVLAANSAQYQAESVMHSALDDLSATLGDDGATTLSTAKGDVYVALHAATTAKAAAASATSYNVSAALTALDAAKAAVADFTGRETDAATAVANAQTALTLANKQPESSLLTQAEQESQDVATQAQIKAQSDYAKALTIQAEIANQKTLAEAYQAEAQQAYDSALAYQAADAAQNATSVADAQSAAAAAATQAQAALDAAQQAKTSGDAAAKLLNKTLDAGENRDVSKELDDRIHAGTGTAVTVMTSLTSAFSSAGSILSGIQSAAAALDNSTVSAKLSAALSALNAASDTSGALASANSAIVNARGQLDGVSAGTKQADIQTALETAQAKAAEAADKADQVSAVDPASVNAVATAKALAQAAATAAKDAAAAATTATDLAKQLSAAVQSLATTQTTVDSAVADASAKVKAAVDLVNWANADYLAVSLTTTARNAIDSTSNSADAVDSKAFILALKSTLNNNSTGIYDLLTAMKSAAASSTADLQATATIQAAYDRATAALATITNAISKIDGANGLLAQAQTALTTAESKTTEALAATTSSDAIAAAAQARTAAAEASRLAELIANYRLQVSNTATPAADSAAEIIQAAYDEAVTANARLATATTMSNLLTPASLWLSQAQTAASEVIKQSNLAQSYAKTANDALGDPSQTYLDIADERDNAHTAAQTAATANSTVASKVANAIANAQSVVTSYEALATSQRTSVLTAYYEQAKKIIIDAGALKTDAADRAATAAQADTVATNAYNTLRQYADDTDAREVAAIDASAAMAKKAIDALANAASQATSTLSTATTLNGSVNTDALLASVGAFLTAHPAGSAYDAVALIQTSLENANLARTAATGKLASLNGTITTESGTANTTYNSVKALDALADPSAGQVSTAAADTTAIQQAATKVSDLAAAMDAQKNALSKAIDQISSLQTQFQSYVDTLSGQTKAAMAVNAVNDAAAFAENAGAQTINLVGNDPQGSGGTLKVIIVSLPTKGTLYLADGTTQVTLGQELDATAASTLKYVPSGALQSPGAVDSTFSDTFNYQLTRSGTVEALVNGSLVDQAYSTSDSATVTLTITHVNYAPTLQGTAPSLPSLGESSTPNTDTNTGVTVSTLLASNATDAETAKANLGMAVTGLSDAGIGQWQYKLSAGGSWTAITDISNSSALLLGPGASLRFVPDANQNSQVGGVNPTITYRAWDKSDGGTAGSTVNTTTNGGFTAYSAATLSAGVTVTAVVLKPTLSLTATELYSPTVDGSPTETALGISVADIPDATTIAISGLPAGASLSAGSYADGVWTLTPGQLGGLTLTTPATYNGDLSLNITATASDGAGATLVTKTDTATLKVGVGAQTVAVDGIADKSTSIRAVIMQGGANADTMTGSDHNDTLIGNGGADTLTGGQGADSLSGGDGGDVFRFTTATESKSGATDTITDFQAGSDTIRLEGIAGIAYLREPYTFSGNTAITLSAINADTMVANAVVFFNDGSDGYLYVKGTGTGTNFDGTFIKLTGVLDRPALSSLDGVTAELVVGTGSDDTVSAGNGIEVLVGGSGLDTFRFYSAADSDTTHPDTIADFTADQDIIRLQDADGYKMLAGAYTWAGSVAATVAAIAADTAIADTLVFFTDGSQGWVYGKGDGTGFAQFDGLLVNLSGVTTQPAALVAGVENVLALNAGNLATTEDASANGSVSVRFASGSFSYDFGLDGDNHPILSQNTEMGTVTIDPVTGAYTYQPGTAAQALAAGQPGSDSFVVHAREAGGTTGSTTVSVALTGANDAPTLTLSGDINQGTRFDSDSYAAGAVVVSQVDGFTVETRFNWSGNNDGTKQVLFYNGNSDTSGWGLGIVGGTLHVLFAGGEQYDTGVSVAAGEWHNVGLTHQSNDWVLFFDGTATPLTPSTTLSTIAAGETVVGNDTTHAAGFNGVIDFTALWSEGRSPSQMSADLAGTITPPAANLAGYWAGDISTVGGPNNLDDSSGNNHTLSSGLDSALFQPASAGLETTEDQAASITLHIGDDADTAAQVTRTIQQAAEHGTVTVTGDVYTYTPASNYSGTDSFVIRLTDSQGASADYVIDVLVRDQNDDPTSTAFDPQALGVLSSVSIDVASHFSDVDALDTLSFGFTNLPPWLSWNEQTGTLTGVVPLGATSSAITVTATDRAGATTSQVLTVQTPEVQIAGVNQSGSSLHFNGTDSTAHAALAMAAAGGTVEAWLQVPDWTPGTEELVFGNAIAVGDPNSITLGIGPDGLVLHYGGIDQPGGKTLLIDTTTFSDGSWHHVAFSWEQNGANTDLVLYVDGVAGQSTTATLQIDASALTTWQVGDSVPSPLSGSIDNLRLWDDVRTGNEIATSMALKTPVDGTDLLANWQMDKVVGGAVVDADTGAQLVLGDSTAVETSDATLRNPPEHALNLNGGYLVLGSPSITSALTFETWVRPDTLSTTSDNFTPIFASGNFYAPGFVSVGYNDSGALVFMWRDNSDVHTVTQDTGALSVDDWNHVAVVVTPISATECTVELYVDGQMVGNDTGPLVPPSQTSDATVGRADEVSSSFVGAVGDLRLYSLSLTAADIAEDMNTRQSEDEYGLMLGLPLDSLYTVDGAIGTNVNRSDDNGFFDSAVLQDGGGIIDTKPQSFTDSLTTREDTPVSSKIMAADSSGDPLNFYVTSDDQPSHGWVRMEQDGTFTYTPREDYVGTDTFTITADDGNGHTATKVVSVTVSAVDDPISGNAPADSRVEAVALRGETAIAIDGGLATGTSAVTYEAWVCRTSNLPSQQTILAVGGGDTSLTLSMAGNGLLVTVNGTDVVGGGAIALGVWHHVAVVVEGTGAQAQVTLYVDGETAPGQTGTYAGTINLNGTLAYLGRDTSQTVGTENFLTGSLSDVRVYTEARSLDDIRADLTGSTANDAHLYARWLCDSASGGVVTDSSGTHDGTVLGYNSGTDDREMVILNAGSSAAVGGVTLYDPDSAPETPNVPAEIAVTLSVGHGLLYFASLAGVTVEGGGNDSATITIKGSLSALNAALADVTYTPTLGFAGRDGVQVVIDELDATVTRKDGGTLDILVMAVPTAGDDVLNGSPKDDVIDGLAGNDTVLGFLGNDTLSGGAGDDLLMGYEGNDVLTGDSGADTLMGSEGNDTLTGGSGADTLTGGVGDDVFRFTSGSDSTEATPDTIDDFGTAATHDVIRLEGMSGIAYDPEASMTSLGLGTPASLAEFLTIFKTQGPANTMLFFSDGSDGYLYVKGAGTGVDFDGTLIRLQGRTTAPLASEVMYGIGTGTTDADVLTGSAAAEVFLGLEGADTIDGGAGDDTLIGGSGADTLTGGAGADVFQYTGSADSNPSGYDVITDFSVVQGDRISIPDLDGMAYDGVAYGTLGATPSDTVLAILGNSNLSGHMIFFAQDGDGYLVTPGGGEGPQVGGLVIKLAGVTTAPPRSAIDNMLTIAGTTDADVLTGTSGDDVVGGIGGDDTINGGAGADTLAGGTGADTLTGGAGADQFRINSAEESGVAQFDVVTDFTTGQDTLVFGGIRGISYDTSPYGAVQATVEQTVTTIGLDAGIVDRAVFFTLGGDGYIYVKTSQGMFADTVVKLAGITTAPALADLPGLTATPAINAAAPTSEVTLPFSATSHDDTVTAVSTAALYGLDGNDTLTGSGGGILVGGRGADTLSSGNHSQFLYQSKHDSNLAEGVDSLTFTDATTQSIVFQGIAGIVYSGIAYNIGGAATVEDAVAAITADSAVADQLVFFALGGDGYLTIKGAGIGADFSGTVIKLTGHTSPLSHFDLPDVLALYTGTAGNDFPAESGFGDLMLGLGGDDTLSGGTGNDILVGGAGGDDLSGNDGADVFRYDTGSDSTLAAYDSITDFTVGTDKIRFTGMKGIGYENQFFEAVSDQPVSQAIARIVSNSAYTDQVVFFVLNGDGYLYVNGAGTGVNFDGTLIRLPSCQSPPGIADIQTGAIIGTDNNDLLVGTSGDDILEGLMGNDTLRGGDGNDTLDGGDGHNVLDGGAGDDRFLTGWATDTVIGGGGNDTVVFKNGTSVFDISRDNNNLVFNDQTVIQDYYNGSSVNTVTLQWDGRSQVTTYSLLASGTGDDGHNILTGTVGADVMSAGNGNDIVLGDDGNDLLLGGAGMDVLKGGAGDDILVGGIEGDMLTGDGGGDVFRFYSAADSSTGEYDTITDFISGVDKLDLVGLNYSGSLQLFTGTVTVQPNPLETANYAASDPSILDNSVVFWEQEGNGYVYVKASGTAQNGLFIQLANFTGPLTSDDIVQLATVSPGTSAYWDAGGSDGLWTTAANWSGDTLPGTDNKVSLTSASATLNDGSSQSIQSLYANSSTLSIANGTLAIGTSSIVDNASTLSLSGNGELAGNGFVAIDGALNWSGGALNLSQGVMTRGTTTIDGGAHTLNTLLALGGDSTLAGATIDGEGELANGGELDVTASSSVGVGLANDGVIRIKTSASASDVTLAAAVGIANSGVIELAARYDSTDTAALTLGTNAALMIGTDGVLRARDDGSASHVVTGEVDLLGGTIQANGDLTISNQGTQTFLGSGTIAVAEGKVLTIDGGSNGGLIEVAISAAPLLMLGDGTVRLAGVQKVHIDSLFTIDAAITLDLAGAVSFTGGDVNNASALTLVGSDDVFFSAVSNTGSLHVVGNSTAGDANLAFYGGLDNSGLLDLSSQSGSTANVSVQLGTAQLNNSGTITVNHGGTGTVTVNGALNNQSTGVINVDNDLTVVSHSQAVHNAGTIAIATGYTLDLTQTLNLDNQGGAKVTGGGTIAGDVTNNGIFAPGGDTTAGTLSVSGSYYSGGSSSLKLDVFNSTDTDKVAVSGAASLAGSLVYGFHSYVPAEGESYVAMTAANGLSESDLWGTDGVANTGDDLITISHDLGSAWTATWAATGTSLTVTFHQVSTQTISDTWSTLDDTSDTSAIDLAAGSTVAITEAVVAGTVRGEGTLTIGSGGGLAVAGKGAFADTATVNLSGGSLGGAGDIAVAGALALSGGTLDGTGVLSAEGTTTLGGNLTVDKRIELRGATTVSGTTSVVSSNSASAASTGQAVNYGTMTVNAIAASFELALINAVGGSMTWNASSAIAQGTPADMTLSLGNMYNSFTNHGDVTWTGGSSSLGMAVTTNGGTLMNDGTITLDAAASSQVDQFQGTLHNEGTLYLGHNLQLDGVIDNLGTLELKAGHSLALSASSSLQNNGEFIGSGTIDDSGAASFVNNGLLSPGGDGIGSLFITDDLTLGSQSVLRVDIGDSLVINGAAALGGDLDIVVGGASLNVGTTYSIVQWASSTGWFSHVNGLDSDPAGSLLLDPILSTTSLSVRPQNVTQTMTNGDDVVSGSNGDDYLLAGAGNDTIHAGSGADAIFGQAGNDEIGITGTGFHIVDGGDGLDSLNWEGADGTTLDLTGYSGILQNLEAINLETAGGQTLTLDAAAVARMMGNQVNAATTTANTLVVIGDSADTVNLNGSWTLTASNATVADDPTASYSVYSSTDAGGSVQVYVDSAVTNINHS